jgi:hypothetical protein
LADGDNTEDLTALVEHRSVGRGPSTDARRRGEAFDRVCAAFDTTA